MFKQNIIFSVLCYGQYFILSTFQFNINFENETILDGQNFIENIIYGKNPTTSKGILYFTAPYKICTGGCENESSFHMVFPLYVGRAGKKIYKEMYSRDQERIYSARSDAPFKKITTRPMWTLASDCPTFVYTTSTVAYTHKSKEGGLDHSSEELGVKPPSVRPDCPVRISKVHFGITHFQRLLRGRN